MTAVSPGFADAGVLPRVPVHLHLQVQPVRLAGACAPAPAPSGHVYAMESGLLFITHAPSTKTMLRRCGTLLLTVNGQPFELRHAGRAVQCRAVVVKPLTAHSLRAEGSKLASVLVNPLHPMFRMFRGVPRDAVVPIAREAFSQHDEALRAADLDELSATDGRALYNGLVHTASRYLPPLSLTCSDEKIDRVAALLRADPRRGLGELARSAGVSYNRLSHLFTQSMGISLRNYQLWLKIHNALSMLDAGATLTEIAEATAFSDLAHLSRVACQALGAPLSTLRAGPGLRKICCRERAQADALPTLA